MKEKAEQNHKREGGGEEAEETEEGEEEHQQNEKTKQNQQKDFLKSTYQYVLNKDNNNNYFNQKKINLENRQKTFADRTDYNTKAYARQRRRINRQKRDISQQQNYQLKFRVRVAFAGLAGSIIGGVLANALQGNYKQNKKLILEDLFYGGLFGSAFVGLSIISTPAVWIASSILLIGQSIHQYNNKYSNKEYNDFKLFANFVQTGTSLGIGIGGTLLGQILIPIPVLGAAFGGLIGGFMGTLGANKIGELERKKKFEKLVEFIIEKNMEMYGLVIL
ncbi:hypothetical protein IMG5_076450 [Ichthyophthirius multifiliis]|uniref:Transmembrane protein n=1 Tax=Ichthyophthirius multifiliis TaxID=5932 RepID=G0QQB4_ICHMU|nr:hypothetical protein IMG5_076450 [Ichthyophthirius multifiliis]EGR32615.1 hypothetical protein IMG5_076450 [Ichthyophthirius multifiliis]|eukprot:XP_004036601.1 hypothetical protein IMG5_076450 [Ichthyophthirius multifiliis]